MSDDEKYKQIANLQNKINEIKDIINDYELDEDAKLYIHYYIFGRQEFQDSISKELSNIMINAIRQEMNKLQKQVDELKRGS